jgi:hypothetical protein
MTVDFLKDIAEEDLYAEHLDFEEFAKVEAKSILSTVELEDEALETWAKNAS